MSNVASQRAQIEQTGFGLSKTYGRSMRPLIWGGEHFVAVTPIDGEPQIGDMLMFTSHDGVEKNILHRLVEIRREHGETIYITRGDNCYSCERVRREDIIGRVEEVHHLSGWRPWHIIHARKFTVNDPAYRRYVHLWTAIWPLRAVVYRLRGYALAALRRLRASLSHYCGRD